MDEAGLSVQSAANQLGHVNLVACTYGRAEMGATRVAEVLEDFFPP